MKKKYPPISLLNRLAFTIYYLPLLLGAVVLCLSLPLVFVWGFVHFDSATQFMRGCTRVLDEHISRMEAARYRLAKRQP